MKILVLGAGRQGIAIGIDLARERDLDRLTLVDRDVDALDSAWAQVGDPRVIVAVGEGRDPESLASVFEEHDVVVSALPAPLNLPLARLAVAKKRHFVDLGGRPEITRGELALHDEARGAGVTILPDCGLSPGLANVIAADVVESYERCDQLRIRTGALPVRSVGPLGFRLLVPVEQLLDDYSGEAEIVRRGQRKRVPALSEVEVFDMPPPFGIGEAAITAGGPSTIPASYEGRLLSYDAKSIRYPGHFEKIRALAALGLLDPNVRELSGGVRVAPRQLVADILEKLCDFPDVPDLVVCRVTGEGDSGGERLRTVVEALDFGEPARGIGSLARMSAFTAASAARRLARRELSMAGAYPPERALAWSDLRNDLEGRNLSFTQRETAITAAIRRPPRMPLGE